METNEDFLKNGGVETFCFLDVKKDQSPIRVADVTYEDEESSLPSCTSLLAISNKFGYIVVGTPSGFVFAKTTEVRTAINEYDPDKPRPFPATVHVNVKDSSVRIMRVSADELSFVVGVTSVDGTNSNILVYDASVLAHTTDPDVEPKQTVTLESEIVDIRLHPAQTTVMAVLLASGVARIVDITTLADLATIQSEDAGGDTTAIGWSEDGSQLMCGMASGKVLLRNLGGVVESTLPVPPSLEEESYKVLNVVWIDQQTMLVTYFPVAPDEDSAWRVFLLKYDSSKVDFQQIEDLCYKSIDSRRPPFLHFEVLRDWRSTARCMIVCASAASADVDVVCLDESNEWAKWVEEGNNLPIPLGERDNEVYPVGTAIDLTDTEEWDVPPTKSVEKQPVGVPVFYLIRDDYTLVSYRLFSTSAAEAGCVYPGMDMPKELSASLLAEKPTSPLVSRSQATTPPRSPSTTPAREPSPVRAEQKVPDVAAPLPYRLDRTLSPTVDREASDALNSKPSVSPTPGGPNTPKERQLSPAPESPMRKSSPVAADQNTSDVFAPRPNTLNRTLPPTVDREVSDRLNSKPSVTVSPKKEQLEESTTSVKSEVDTRRDQVDNGALGSTIGSRPDNVILGPTPGRQSNNVMQGSTFGKQQDPIVREPPAKPLPPEVVKQARFAEQVKGSLWHRDVYERLFPSFSQLSNFMADLGDKRSTLQEVFREPRSTMPKTATEYTTAHVERIVETTEHVQGLATEVVRNLSDARREVEGLRDHIRGCSKKLAHAVGYKAAADGSTSTGGLQQRLQTEQLSELQARSKAVKANLDMVKFHFQAGAKFSGSGGGIALASQGPELKAINDSIWHIGNALMASKDNMEQLEEQLNDLAPSHKLRKVAHVSTGIPTPDVLMTAGNYLKQERFCLGLSDTVETCNQPMFTDLRKMIERGRTSALTEPVRIQPRGVRGSRKEKESIGRAFPLWQSQPQKPLQAPVSHVSMGHSAVGPTPSTQQPALQPGHPVTWSSSRGSFFAPVKPTEIPKAFSADRLGSASQTHSAVATQLDTAASKAPAFPNAAMMLAPASTTEAVNKPVVSSPAFTGDSISRPAFSAPAFTTGATSRLGLSASISVAATKSTNLRPGSASEGKPENTTSAATANDSIDSKFDAIINTEVSRLEDQSLTETHKPSTTDPISTQSNNNAQISASTSERRLDSNTIAVVAKENGEEPEVEAESSSGLSLSAMTTALESMNDDALRETGTEQAVSYVAAEAQTATTEAEGAQEEQPSQSTKRSGKLESVEPVENLMNDSDVSLSKDESTAEMSATDPSFVNTSTSALQHSGFSANLSGFGSPQSAAPALSAPIVPSQRPPQQQAHVARAFAQSPGTSPFGQAGLEQRMPAAPVSGQPSFGQPSFGQPSFGQPSFGRPSLGQTTFGQPSFGQSSWQSSPSSAMNAPPAGGFAKFAGGTFSGFGQGGASGGGLGPAGFGTEGLGFGSNTQGSSQQGNQRPFGSNPAFSQHRG